MCVYALRDVLGRQDGALRVPYAEHALAVARRLASLGSFPEAVCAAILHECFEQGLISAQEASQRYGSEVAALLQSAGEPGDLTARLLGACDQLQHLHELAELGLGLLPERVNCLWALLRKLPPRFRQPLSDELAALTGTLPAAPAARSVRSYRPVASPRGRSSDLN
jgi:hypothetical protein